MAGADMSTEAVSCQTTALGLTQATRAQHLGT